MKAVKDAGQVVKSLVIKGLQGAMTLASKMRQTPTSPFRATTHALSLGSQGGRSMGGATL